MGQGSRWGRPIQILDADGSSLREESEMKDCLLCLRDGGRKEARGRGLRGGGVRGVSLRSDRLRLRGGGGEDYC
jgi:hypothetical protein